MSYTITIIPGDGIGPEVTTAACKVLEATGVKFNWEIGEAGAGVMEKYGTPLPDSVIASIRKNKVALKGPVTTPIGVGFRSVNVALRKSLADLPDWSAASLHAAVGAVAESQGLGLGKVAQPLRVALTGGAVSPPIDQTLALIGRERGLARLDRALQHIK